MNYNCIYASEGQNDNVKCSLLEKEHNIKHCQMCLSKTKRSNELDLIKPTINKNKIFNNVEKANLQLPNIKLSKKGLKYENWPFWAKGLKLLSKKEDKGLGDTVERIIGTENSEAFKNWYKEKVGSDCPCKSRKEKLNRLYQLEQGTDSIVNP